MGNYNPHVPRIIGQEWVPIRDEDLNFAPSANAVEVGHKFTLAATRNIVEGRFYVNDWPPGASNGAVLGMAIYPDETVDETGPVRRVIIPCNNGGVTGNVLFDSPPFIVAQKVFSPSDTAELIFHPGFGSNGRAQFFFATNSYSAALSGKRILGVNVLYSAVFNEFQGSATLGEGSSALTLVQNNLGQGPVYLLNNFTDKSLIINQNIEVVNAPNINRIRLGEVSPFWDTGDLSTTKQRLPWRYIDLQRFEASNSNRIFFEWSFFTNHPTTDPSISLTYVALEVFYCEETRIGVGGFAYGGAFDGTGATTRLTLGANPVPMVVPNTLGLVSLVPGEYLVTVSAPDPGDISLSSFPSRAALQPDLSALRELYAMPSHPGQEIRLPFPMDETAVGKVFTSEETHILPQLSLHTTGGPTSEVHVYGRQAAAQVYGNIVTIQDVEDSVVGTNIPWPQVRYYARRFGDTTTALRLDSPSFTAGLSLPGISGNYASTPDNAALDIVGDIDLRADITLNDWASGSNSSIISKWGGAGARSYLLQVSSTGNIALVWSADGTATLAAVSTVAIPVSQNFGRIAIRATLDVNNGAAGRDITFFTGPTLNGPWTQLGAVVTQAGVTSIFNSASQVEVSGHTNGTQDIFPGVIHAAEIRNGIAGAVVANPDFAAQAPGTTVFVDGAGRTWTINTSGTGQVAVIIDTSDVMLTPAEWDALPEIVDGWKEITKRFTTLPVMGIGTAKAWRWTAAGEAPGNRWEVLGAVAPSLSGTPGNLLNLTTQQLYSVTYLAPAGAFAELTWLPQGIGSPPVSTATADDSTDAVLIFAQDMPTITGFGISVLNQPLTGIGQLCGINPCCIPSALSYNRITWPFPSGSSYATDSFNRVVVNGTGNADVGGPYTLSGGVASEYAVNGSELIITPNAASKDTRALLSTGPNFDVTVTAGVEGVIVPGGRAAVGIDGRFTDPNNSYLAFLLYDPATGIQRLTLAQVVAAVFTSLGEVQFTNLSINSDGRVSIRFMGQGPYLKLKAWPAIEPEPSSWQIEVVSSTITTGNLAGIFGSSVDVVGTQLGFENLLIIPPSYWFGHYELQRMDTVETEWLTIMKATSPAVTGFNDYEARVGILSSYRIRGVDVYGFEGPWSSTVSATFSAPGVSGGCIDQGHVLIFTSNERQTGSINLAYSSVWMERRVQEDFAFPEAGFVTLQAMYNRDFFTAFRPLERGGERFTREVLVQAAAIAPETLGDFTSLRDMAWESVSYICVRDEDGNRWFATVLVPNGRVLRDRKLYIAPVEIIEVTDIPSQVDATP